MVHCRLKFLGTGSLKMIQKFRLFTDETVAGVQDLQHKVKRYGKLSERVLLKKENISHLIN